MRSDIKKTLSKKKKKRTCNLTIFFSVLYLYRALPILLYIPLVYSCAKVGFCPSYHAFHYFFFYSYLNFSVQENNATCLDFYKQCPEQPPSRPPLAPRPPSAGPQSGPPHEEKNVHNYSAVDDLFSGSWFLSMPYNARAKQKKVQLSALIVCLRGIFEDKYYELSQKPKKTYLPTSLL